MKSKGRKSAGSGRSTSPSPGREIPLSDLGLKDKTECGCNPTQRRLNSLLKARILLEMVATPESLAAASKKHDVSVETIQHWIRQLEPRLAAIIGY